MSACALALGEPVCLSCECVGQSGQKHGLAPAGILRVYGWIYESVGASPDRACGLPHIYYVIVVFVLIPKFRSSITRRVNEWTVS